MRIFSTWNQSSSPSDHIDNVQPIDPVSLWKGGAAAPITQQSSTNDGDDSFDRIVIGEHKVNAADAWTLFDSKSRVYTRLSQMPFAQQSDAMGVIVANWPSRFESCALLGPLYGAVPIATLYSSMRISKKVVDYFRLSHLRSLKYMSPYSSVLLGGAMTLLLLRSPVYTDDHLRQSNVFARLMAAGFFSGFIVPIIATPLICHTHLISQGVHQPSRMTSKSELVGLMSESIRRVWRLLPRLFVAHVVFYAAASYTIIWARDRILHTLDLDPILMHEMMQIARQAEMKSSNGFVSQIRKLFRWKKQSEEDEARDEFKRDVASSETSSRLSNLKFWPWN